MATNEADLGGRLFPGGEAQRGLTPDSTNTIQLPESEVGILESTTIPKPTPSIEAHPHSLNRRGFLKIGLGAAAAAGAAALGRIIIPGLSSDGDGSGSGGDGDLSSQPIKTGETPTAQVTQPPVETVKPSPTATQEVVATPEKEPKTLREAADKIGMKIGVMVGGYGSPEDYRKVTEIQKKEFNLGYVFTGWNFMEPQRGSINYSPLQGDLNLALQSDMETFSGPLIYGDAVPQWIKQGNFSRDELLDLMNGRIKDVMERGKGKIGTYKVVNEAYTSGDVFRRVIGDDYIVRAFETARKVDAKAKLVYNDFDNHTASGPRSSRVEHTRKIVDRLKSEGLIDMVGLEMIIPYAQTPTKESVIEAMQGYGLPVIVTEFGVNLKDLKGTQEERFAKQADVYRSMLSAAIESGVCKDFIVFQVVDRLATWDKSREIPGASPDNDPTPFDDNFQPKPAYDAMLDVLKKASI
ncbi:MAG: endo-1,4-beta-xylanase [Candidatus Levybacteria bacterium]|nr:endo-1,4-beta-xylanase [Candidatus Levybacteria bacterium]